MTHTHTHLYLSPMTPNTAPHTRWRPLCCRSHPAVSSKKTGSQTKRSSFSEVDGGYRFNYIVDLSTYLYVYDDPCGGTGQRGLLPLEKRAHIPVRESQTWIVMASSSPTRGKKPGACEMSKPPKANPMYVVDGPRWIQCGPSLAINRCMYICCLHRPKRTPAVFERIPYRPQRHAGSS